VSEMPRLFSPGGPLGLRAHLERYGALPLGRGAGPRLMTGVERAGLTGRGGAGFPAGRKMRAVAGGARGRAGPAVVVGNGVESEPASGKDAMLLSQSPHLVLDGIAAAAAAVGAH
jgi:NADH:ubiquinone oxidoreductase subunit F (NADH-binding)